VEKQHPKIAKCFVQKITEKNQISKRKIMCIIYLAETINLLAQKDKEQTEKLLQSGEIKQTDLGVKYLKIVEE
jgi:uncharacterized phage-associated protein